jgi:transposase
MRARWAKVDPAHGAPGHSGNRHQQWCRFLQRKKHPVVANVAIARELAGWCWVTGHPGLITRSMT